MLMFKSARRAQGSSLVPVIEELGLKVMRSEVSWDFRLLDGADRGGGRAGAGLEGIIRSETFRWTTFPLEACDVPLEGDGREPEGLGGADLRREDRLSFRAPVLAPKE